MNNKSRFNKKIQLLKSNLRLSKKMGLKTLENIKTSTSSSYLFDLYHHTITRSDMDRLNEHPFPSNPSELFQLDTMIKTSSIANEIIWSISTLLLYRDKIKFFIDQSQYLEMSVLSNNSQLFENILEKIQGELGWSFWLIENKISYLEHWLNAEEKRAFIREVKEKGNNNLFLDILVHFVGQRVEGTSIPGYLESELSRHFKTENLKYLHEYFKSKIFDMNNLSGEQVALLLSFDFKSSIVDLYESLIASLRWIISDESLTDKSKKILSNPIAVLYRATKDKRLLPVLISFDCEIQYSNTPIREAFIESYSSGEYHETSHLGDKYFEDPENLTDMSALFILVKAEKKLKKEKEYNGFIETIASNIRKVISFDRDSYTAALEINTLNDRFMNHTWSTYLKLAVMNELSYNSFNSYPDFMRDLYAREVRLSPFSLTLATPEVDLDRILNIFGNDKFPITQKVLEITTTGKTSNNSLKSQINKDRILKYLGRYLIVKKEYKESLATFYEALKFSDNSESLKINTAIIVAQMRSGDLYSAVTSLVNTYLKWKSTPTALPFEEIIVLLDDPGEWPSTICLPIVLALYTNYFKNDKLAHLRYAFELYNTNNSISTPSSLINNNDIDPHYKILYFQMVWRPEIMGQTILYSGTKDIDEARVQVCKALIEIDGDNASEYQAEIREIVKNIELAKAAELVDQSRVYVDITAIKKSLKVRLSDVYSKYKNSIHPEDIESTELIEFLGEVFGNIDTTNSSISSIVNYLDIDDNEDSQFSAMLSEITNEFLMGEHGLNAYLSTRVRHGKFSNAIRKPIADEYLITEKSEGNNTYSRNTYWNERLIDLNDDERENVLSLLEVFGQRIDEIISFVRDELIQVRIENEQKSFIGKSNGLFEYKTSSFERLYAKTKFKRLANIDEFIDSCIDSLWEKTDINLLKVKNYIQGSIKANILLAFDKLNESLGQMGYLARLGELPNHIARARTSIQHQIANVATWFKRSEVYDRPDYAIDFPVLIAKTMISNSISGADNWTGLTINQIENFKLLPGRTLDGMVDVYCALFENAIEHSGLPVSQLEIEVHFSFDYNTLQVTVINNIEHGLNESYNLIKLDAIRNEIKKKDTRLKAQKERGSGFHKVWSTINSPQYISPSLNFNYTADKKFKVDIEFKIEVNDEQNNYN